MNERMITIPFEEYEELKHFKRMAKEEYMKIYLKAEIFDFGHSYKWWEIYTKDEAVRKITDELIEARKELEKSKEQCKKLEEENEKACYRIGWKSIVEMILVLSIIMGFMYLYQIYL